MRNIVKPIYFFFLEIYLFFESISNDGFSEWKAALVVQTLQIFILLILFGWLEILTGGNIIPTGDPKLWGIPIAIGLAIINYCLFLRHSDLKTEYLNELKTLSRKKRAIISVLTIIACLSVALLLVFTFYKYSQVNWS